MRIEERDIGAALRALPDQTPPSTAWKRIRRQAEAEGLIRSGRSRRMRTNLEWLAAGAIAATLAFVLLDLSVLGPQPRPERAIDDGRFAATPATNEESLRGLMQRSRLLEEALRAVPDRPRVVRAGTASTITTLEDRIALIDQQLSFPKRPLTAQESRALWRERVQLMDSLVKLRYAQSRRVVL